MKTSLVSGAAILVALVALATCKAETEEDRLAVFDPIRTESTPTATVDASGDKVTLTLTITASADADSYTITGAALNDAPTTTKLPVLLGEMKKGDKRTINLEFDPAVVTERSQYEWRLNRTVVWKNGLSIKSEMNGTVE